MHRRGCRIVDVVAVCDSDAARRATVTAMLATATGEVPAGYADIDGALEDPAVEAVDIVLPTWLHHMVVVEALSAGKHVLVEKPLGITVRACDLIAQAAEQTKLVVAVAENYRRIPGNRAIGHLVRSGALGELHHMTVRNISEPPVAMDISGSRTEVPRWYHDPVRGGAYQALEMGVHEADLIRYWFGDVLSVSAEFSGLSTVEARPGQARDSLFASLRHRSGLVSQLAFSSISAGPDIADRLIVGERGRIRSGAWHNWQGDGGQVEFSGDGAMSATAATRKYLDELDEGERDRLFPPGSYREDALESVATLPLSYGVGAALCDFGRAIRDSREPEIGIGDARLSVAVCYALLESFVAQRAVAVDDVLSGHISAYQDPINAALGIGGA
jgi:predicted dehydrogenase